jgi:ketosteroid isomerase-like protein
METKNQEITIDEVHKVFGKLENGDGADFFLHVADNVDWIVEGHHPLAGHYYSKADFIAGTFEKLNKILPGGTQLHCTNTLICDDWAIVELASLATAKNGMRFDNKYCWLTRWENKLIVEVRAYLDSAMVQRLFDENPL